MADRPVPYKALDPGIRETVRWLNANGFRTTDSGDGVTKSELIAEGYALDVPHVFIRAVCAHEDANRLMFALIKRGFEVRPGMIQATYDPANIEVQVVAFVGVNDEMLASVLRVPGGTDG